MSYNPNKDTDTKLCTAIENLYSALKQKGITLKGLELSKPLTLFGSHAKDIPLSFGLGYNKKHIKVKAVRQEEDSLQDIQSGRLVFIPIQTKQTILALEKLEWRASMREISEITGQAITTVCYHIDQLRQLGVLKKVGPRKYSLQLSLNSETNND